MDITDTSPDIICRVIFGLEFPPTEESLKSEFKSRTMNGEFRHPDRGGEHEKFIELKESYETLLPFCNINSKQSFNPRTTSGFLISDLGKGLGSTVNGVECNICEGQGYFSITVLKTVPGSRRSRCGVCEGLGYRFRLILGFSLETGLCKECGGSGISNLVRVEVTELTRCSTCKGIGELPISNPVLQKGGLSLQSKNHKPKKVKKVSVPNPLFKYKELV